MSKDFHKFWLKITSIIIGAFGPVFFFGTMTETMEPARFTMDLLSWPINGVPNYQSTEVRFLSAVTGGFLLGWGVMVWFLSSLVYDKAPEAIRKSVLFGLLSWFFLDSAGSITSENPSNALFNIPVLLIAVGPMWFPAKNSISLENKNNQELN